MPAGKILTWVPCIKINSILRWSAQKLFHQFLSLSQTFNAEFQGECYKRKAKQRQLKKDSVSDAFTQRKSTSKLQHKWLKYKTKYDKKEIRQSREEDIGSCGMGGNSNFQW